MSSKEILSVISGLLAIPGCILYIRAMLRGKTKPAKSSWLIWASVNTILLFGMLAAHTVNGQIIGVVIGTWVVALFSIKYGIAGWTKLDKFCFGAAALGITLWQIFNNPVIGIIASLSVLSLGSIPTFVSTWHDPNRENRTTWTISWLSCVLAIIAIPAFTLADAAQPIIFCILNNVMMYLLYFRSRSINH